jgi:hypothetical protein
MARQFINNNEPRNSQNYQLCSSNTSLAERYISGAKITFPEYTDSLTTFCQHISQHFLTSVQNRPKNDRYNTTNRINPFLFINPEHVKWEPQEEVEDFGLIQEDIVMVMKNDYNLH